jgi:hypothetical protein
VSVSVVASSTNIYVERFERYSYDVCDVAGRMPILPNSSWPHGDAYPFWSEFELIALVFN